MKQACIVSVGVLFNHIEFEIPAKHTHPPHSPRLLASLGTTQTHGTETDRHASKSKEKQFKKNVNFAFAIHTRVKLGENQERIASGSAVFAFLTKQCAFKDSSDWELYRRTSQGFSHTSFEVE